MTRGRKPTPNHLKLITGNPGKRKMPHRELSQSRRLHPTKDLRPEEKKIWARTIKHAPHGLLQPIDAELLTLYVVAMAFFNLASKNLDESPPMLKSPKGYPFANPWFGIMNQQGKRVHSLASELGFSPTSRARLGVDDNQKPLSEVEASFFDD